MMKTILVLLFLALPLCTLADVTTQSYSVTFSCTGSMGPYSFTFPISAAGALTVTKDGTLVGSGAYTIVPVNNNYENGGKVTLNTACASGSTLVLARVTPLTQATVFTDNMPTPMKTFERSLDKLTEIAQEQSGDINSLATWSCATGSVAAGFADFVPQCVTTITGILVPPPTIAGTQLTVNPDATAAVWQKKIAVQARDFPETDCGAKINAADAYLTATYGANIGSIIVDKNCGQTINTTVVINGHTLHVLGGAGNFTSNLSGSSFAIPIRLKSNSSLICDDWSTVIQESSTVGARQTIVDAFNAQAANLHDDNILVQGCHFQGANVAYSGAVQTIELGNCHNCRVTGNFFDAVRGIAVGIGGASGSTYADNVWATDNLVINGPTQIFAVVNGQNWHISRNISVKPGAANGSAIGSTVDIEPNSNTDKAGPGEITNNIFDFRAATVSGGYPITVTTWEAPGILIDNNDMIGGLLPTETGGPTRNISNCVSVLAHSPSFPTGLRITNNHCSMTTGAPYNFIGVVGSEIANNLAICPGGSNGYIRMQAGSQNNNIHSNSFTDPCSASSSVNENIEEDGASISNNRIWGNLATRAALVGTGSIEAFRVDPTTGLLTADSYVTSGPNGGSVTTTSISENITLSTSGTTTDSGANLLPANATINAVGCRVSTTITTATDWSIGDASTAARFGAANAVMTAGSTTNSTGTAWTTGIASATTGIKQGAAAKLRITATGTPGAGAIRCTVFYSQPTPPTS